jgi:thiol-disulfide isomerase/thioredoxin
MKSWVLLAILGVAVLVLGAYWYANARPRSDQEMLAELTRLGDPIDPNQDKLAKKRGDQARELLKEFEARHPQSPLLNDARAAAFKALTLGGTPQVGAVEVARALVADTPRGSELAAPAAHFLLLHDLQPMLGKEAGRDNTAAIRMHIDDFLTAYPRYSTGAESIFEHLLQLADDAADLATHEFIIDLATRDQPAHPLAKRREFVLAFTPVGSTQATSMKDLRGKVVVVDFWATWCGPCVAELPALKRLYDEYHPRGLEIVGVSLDDNQAQLRKFVQDRGVRWPQVFGRASQELRTEWGVRGIPTVFLVDRQGRLRNVEARGKLERLVPALLEEK